MVSWNRLFLYRWSSWLHFLCGVELPKQSRLPGQTVLGTDRVPRGNSSCWRGNSTPGTERIIPRFPAKSVPSTLPWISLYSYSISEVDSSKKKKKNYTNVLNIVLIHKHLYASKNMFCVPLLWPSAQLSHSKTMYFLMEGETRRIMMFQGRHIKKYFKQVSSFLWQRKHRISRKMMTRVKKTIVRVKERAQRTQVKKALMSVKMGEDSCCCSSVFMYVHYCVRWKYKEESCISV